MRLIHRAGPCENGPCPNVFDTDSADAFAVLMQYDEAGHFAGFERTVEPAVLERCRNEREIALRYSVSLNTYLAERKAVDVSK